MLNTIIASLMVGTIISPTANTIEKTSKITLEEVSDQNQKMSNYIITNEKTLDSIDETLIKNSIFSIDNNSYFNGKILEKAGVPIEFKNYLEQLKFENISREEIINFLFQTYVEPTNVEPIKSEIQFRGWKVWTEAKKPQHWYQWLSFHWNLYFNHEFCQDFVDGLATTEDVAELIDDAMGEIPWISASAKAVAIAVTGLGFIWNVDKGNGIRINFLTYVVPYQIKPI